jgi:uncharacterized protein (UPF0303 family)
MNEIQVQLLEIEKQESELVFDKFNSDTALNLGLLIMEKAKKLQAKIAIDISKNGHQLFHFALEGSSPDNDEWIKRKSRLVYRTFKSSLYIGLILKLENKSLEEKYLLSSMDYAPFGGSFPLKIKSCGTVGAITVSGLPQLEDHALVVEALREYLGK